MHPTPDEPSPDLLCRLNDRQRELLLRIDLTLDAASWDPTAIDTLSTTLSNYTNVLSSLKLDYGECSLHPLKSKFLRGPSRCNRAHTDRTQSSLNKPTPFSTPTLLSTSFNIPHIRSRAPSYAFQTKSGNLTRSQRFHRFQFPTLMKCLTLSAVALLSQSMTFARGLLS